MTLRRRLASLAALGAGIVATAASTSAAPGDIFDSAGPFAVTLSTDAPIATHSVSALLAANAPLEAQSGEMRLDVTFPAGAAGQVFISIASDTTGESNDAQVLDPEDQPQVGIAVLAFNECDGLSECQEDFTVELERLDEGEDDLELDWQVDGSVSVVADEETPVTGTLTLTVD